MPHNCTTLAQLRQLIKSSISYGTLRENWHEEKNELILLTSGYLSILEDTSSSYEGDIFHTEDEGDRYVWSEKVCEYLREEYAYKVYTSRGNEDYWPGGELRNVYEYQGDYYTWEALEYNDLVLMDNGEVELRDNVYYWESDGEYHYEPEEDENEDEDIFDYHSGKEPKDFRTFADGELSIGFEIEKNEMPGFSFDKYNLLNEGFVIERDGSVSDGFELVTPIYPLFREDVKKHLEKVKSFCDVKNIEGAGGHINFGIYGKSAEEILDSFKGLLPLIYAMYKGRLTNNYCTGKSLSKLKMDREKYQAIKLQCGYIEFRLISAVKNFDNLIFRLDLFRVFASYLNKSFPKIISALLNEKSALSIQLHKVYTPEKYKQLLIKAIDMHLSYGDHINQKLRLKYEGMKTQIIAEAA
jgi:hypothetical protein